MIAVDVNVGGLEEPRLETVVDVAVHLALLWCARTAREEEGEADLVIGVDARGIALHDLTRGPELLRRGREAARAALPAIRDRGREPAAGCPLRPMAAHFSRDRAGVRRGPA